MCPPNVGFYFYVDFSSRAVVEDMPWSWGPFPGSPMYNETSVFIRYVKLVFTLLHSGFQICFGPCLDRQNRILTSFFRQKDLASDLEAPRASSLLEDRFQTGSCQVPISKMVWTSSGRLRPEETFEVGLNS